MSMTPEQQRIAIAEWCGIDCSPMDVCKCGDHAKNHTYEHGVVPMMDLSDIPNYLNDLNAMHEAEEKLTYEQLCQYVYDLALVHMQTLNRNDWDYVGFVHIPANERAEALLRTIGKWEDKA